ncbi:Kinesin light chain 3 [Borealophlyctis nickersoniae]|nr:Kinesin light chain 3 [Borealophlyctis nickersoniae]
MRGTDLQLCQKTSSSDHLEAFSLRLSYFDTFIDEWCGGREKLHGWTTTAVCKKVVKPRTKKSVCDHLVEEDSPAVGRATWFISHAWKYEFLDIVDAVKHHFHESSTPDVIVWFDLFSNSQHDTAEKPFTWWTGTFTNAISELGSVLMILHPWNNPITLKRAWCIFELYACTNTKSHFAIALPPRHTPAFRTSLRDNPGAFYNMLATIKSANSVAFKNSDRLAIHAAIREKVGFSALDRMVLSVLSNWMVSTLRSHILLTEKAGNEVEHATWLSSLARLFMDHGRYEDAEPPYVGKYEKAEPLYVACLERWRLVLGEDDPNTLSSISNLAALYHNQGEHEKAERLYVDCVERRRGALGEDHPNTLMSMNNLAGLYMDQGEGRAAARGLSGETEAGAWKGSSKHTYICQQPCYVGKYEKAELLYTDCLERRRGMLGEDHPNTLTSINNLATLYSNQGKHEKAGLLYAECLERRRGVLGEDHPDTLVSLNNLAELYMDQGKYEKAEPLHVDCLRRMNRVLGEDHPNTQTVRKNLAFLREALAEMKVSKWRTEITNGGRLVDLRCYDTTIRNRTVMRDFAEDLVKLEVGVERGVSV